MSLEGTAEILKITEIIVSERCPAATAEMPKGAKALGHDKQILGHIP